MTVLMGYMEEDLPQKFKSTDKRIILLCLFGAACCKGKTFQWNNTVESKMHLNSPIFFLLYITKQPIKIQFVLPF